MSNHLAIATVTAVLKKVLQEGIAQDVPGAQITTVRPDAPGGSNISGACLNIFLYHALPNQAWRNADLRTRRPKGDLVKHGQASLDLHYLLTFYGNEQRFEPQRLMGSAIQTLVDHPLITQDLIQDTIASAGIRELEGSTLGEQVQAVRFFPNDMTTEELSRIWSVFFQVPYSLSFAYQGTAVLIQGRKPGKSPLPVRNRRIYTSPSRPIVEQVKAGNRFGDPSQEPITLDSRILIQGRQLKHPQVRVHLGQARLVPHNVSDHQIEVSLTALSQAERDQLRAGAQTVRVAHVESSSNLDQDHAILSNVLPIVLCPTVASTTDAIILQDLVEVDDEYYSGPIRVRVDVSVAPHQATYLMLNDRDRDTQVYICKGERRKSQTQQLIFPLEDVQAGTYLLRIQIDGAESPLTMDSDERSSTFQQFIGPTVTIGSAATDSDADAAGA